MKEVRIATLMSALDFFFLYVMLSMIFNLFQILVTVKDVNSHNTAMIRRKAVSQWLESVSKPLVELETARVFRSEDSQFPLKEDYIDGILSLLSGRQIMEACQKAQDYGLSSFSCVFLLFLVWVIICTILNYLYWFIFQVITIVLFFCPSFLGVQLSGN